MTSDRELFRVVSIYAEGRDSALFSFDFEPEARTIKPVSFWERSPQGSSLISALLKADDAFHYLANGVEDADGKPKSPIAKVIQSIEDFDHRIKPVGELDIASGFTALDYLVEKRQLVIEGFSGWQKLDAQLSRNNGQELSAKCCAFLQGILWLGFSETSRDPLGWATIGVITGQSLIDLLRT